MKTAAPLELLARWGLCVFATTKPNIYTRHLRVFSPGAPSGNRTVPAQSSSPVCGLHSSGDFTVFLHFFFFLLFENDYNCEVWSCAPRPNFFFFFFPSDEVAGAQSHSKHRRIVSVSHHVARVWSSDVKWLVLARPTERNLSRLAVRSQPAAASRGWRVFPFASILSLTMMMMINVAGNELCVEKQWGTCVSGRLWSASKANWVTWCEKWNDRDSQGLNIYKIKLNCADWHSTALWTH